MEFGKISGILDDELPKIYSGVAIWTPTARPIEMLATVTAMTVARDDGITSVIMGTLLTKENSKVR